MSIHQRFKEVRKKLNFTQSEFGEQLGKKLRAIQYYEANDSNITLDIILLLQEKFNINSDWLINGNGSMFLEEKKDDSKYQWLITTLDKLSDDDIKKVEQEAQKILEKQNNKEMIVNHSKNIG